jgi:ParB family transcriptional regulator, chromosome partitioning protein
MSVDAPSIINTHNKVIEQIPIRQLDADEEFNCRGHIAPIDVAELVQSIQEHGLQYPILVHPYNEEEQKAKGKKYRLVSGYRRYTAMKILGYPDIPCILSKWMTEDEARVLNLIENIKRENLNIVQEAKSIEKLRMVGYTEEDIANKLGLTKSWVHMRCIVLSFPPEIQVECAEGILNQNHIKDLASLTTAEQFEAVRTIKDKKLRGERYAKVKKRVATQSKKARDRAEIQAMLNHIYDVLKSNFGTRCLAWASGNISSLELFGDIKKLAEEKGKIYTIPEYELEPVRKM